MKIIIKNKKLKENSLSASDGFVTKIIRIFASNQNNFDVSDLKSKLQNLGIDPLDAIKYLYPNKKGDQKISSQLLSKAVELHNSMCRDPNDKQPEREIKPDAFQQFPKIGHNSNKVPIGNKETSIQDQEDTRKNVKNLKAPLSEEISSIEDFILNNLRFKLKNIDSFKKELDSYYNEYYSHYDFLETLKKLYNTNKLNKDQAEKIFNIVVQYKSEKDDELNKDQPTDSDQYPPSNPFDKSSHLSVVKEKIIKFGIGSPFKRK